MDQLRYGRSRQDVRQPHQVCEVCVCDTLLKRVGWELEQPLRDECGNGE